MELRALNKELRNKKASYVIYLTDNINKYIFLYYDNGFNCLLKITDSSESKIKYKNHFVKFILSYDCFESVFNKSIKEKKEQLKGCLEHMLRYAKINNKKILKTYIK